MDVRYTPKTIGGRGKGLTPDGTLPLAPKTAESCVEEGLALASAVYAMRTCMRSSLRAGAPLCGVVASWPHVAKSFLFGLFIY